MSTATPDNLPALGNCYENTATLMHRPNLPPGTVLVHGRPTLTRAPFCEYGHAWIELPGGWILDGNNLDGGAYPKAGYYRAGSIDPDECVTYTRDEVLAQILEHEHYGPWQGPDLWNVNDPT